MQGSWLKSLHFHLRAYVVVSLQRVKFHEAFQILPWCWLTHTCLHRSRSSSDPSAPSPPHIPIFYFHFTNIVPTPLSEYTHK